MAFGYIRQNLDSRVADKFDKSNILKEYEYFARIAPKSIFSAFANDPSKRLEGDTVQVLILIIVLLCMVPVLLLSISIIMPFIIFGGVIWCFLRRALQSPEYRAYNYRDRLALPMLRLFDERLDMGYHFVSGEISNPILKFDDALVEAHLVRPFNRVPQRVIHSLCSYDWYNQLNADAFEFGGYRLYYEWVDSDGDSHTETYFDGLLFKFRTEFIINGSVNIMSTRTKKTILGKEKETNRFKKIKDRDVNVIDTENHEFAECFDTVATFEEEAYRYLTPSQIEKLLMLRKECDFCICLQGNIMTVSINKTSFRHVNQDTFSDRKPTSRPNNPAFEAERRIEDMRQGLISIFELKDILNPGV